MNEEKRNQFYASFKQEYSNDMELNVKAFYTDYDIIDNYSVPSLPNLNFPSISADNPTNPFRSAANTALGSDVVILGRHNPTLDFDQSRAAPRENTTFRLEGDLDGSFSSGWDWTTSLAYSTNTYKISQPEMSQDRLNMALAGNGGPNGDLQFDHFDPTNNDPALIEWLKTDFKSETTTSLLVADAVVNGEAFEMPAGVANVAVGIQLRREGYEVDPATNSTITYDADGNPEASDFTFLGAVNEVDESRSAKAVFAEIELPITDSFTANAAVRYEDLATASSVDPKLALLYQATDNLSFRGSASTSFREPSLSQINADVVNTKNVRDVQFDGSGNPVTDGEGNFQVDSGASIFIRETTTGNKDLEPEQATNYNLGAIWSSEEWDVRADYWRIDYEDVITIESAQAVLLRDPNGPTVVRQDPSDPSSNLAGISVNYFNAQTIDASGFDLEVKYTTDLLNGELKLGAGISRYLSYEIPDGDGSTTDVVGAFNHDNFVRSMPATKGSLSALWTNNIHSFYAKANYVSSYNNHRPELATPQIDTVDSFTTVDLQYSYLQEVHGDNEFLITLGVLNAFDQDPPFVRDGANFSYDPKHHDPRGRMFYVRGSYQF